MERSEHNEALAELEKEAIRRLSRLAPSPQPSAHEGALIRWLYIRAAEFDPHNRSCAVAAISALATLQGWKDLGYELSDDEMPAWMPAPPETRGAAQSLANRCLLVSETAVVRDQAQFWVVLAMLFAESEDEIWDDSARASATRLKGMGKAVKFASTETLWSIAIFGNTTVNERIDYLKQIEPSNVTPEIGRGLLWLAGAAVDYPALLPGSRFPHDLAAVDRGDDMTRNFCVESVENAIAKHIGDDPDRWASRMGELDNEYSETSDSLSESNALADDGDDDGDVVDPDEVMPTAFELENQILWYVNLVILRNFQRQGLIVSKLCEDFEIKIWETPAYYMRSSVRVARAMDIAHAALKALWEDQKRIFDPRARSEWQRRVREILGPEAANSLPSHQLESVAEGYRSYRERDNGGYPLPATLITKIAPVIEAVLRQKLITPVTKPRAIRLEGSSAFDLAIRLLEQHVSAVRRMSRGQLPISTLRNELVELRRIRNTATHETPIIFDDEVRRFYEIILEPSNPGQGFLARLLKLRWG